MKYFSLFSGIGGFELGFPREWQCVGFSEIDKYVKGSLPLHVGQSFDLEMTEEENNMLVEYAVVNILKDQFERMENEHRSNRDNG